MVDNSILSLGGLPETVNESFFDAMVRHQIGLLRLSGSIRNRSLKLLDDVEADMAETIRRRLRSGRGLATPERFRRMTAVIAALRRVRNAQWNSVEKLWIEEMVALASAEPKFIAASVRAVSPTIVSTTLPRPALLRSIVTTRPFQGRTLGGWLDNMRAADLNRIEGAVRVGMVQGDGSAAIARRVVGTRRLLGRDGVTQITRHNVQAIVRTAVNAVSNQAKRDFYQANDKLFTRELYVATLDNRTTTICASLDGRRFPIAEGPIPPLHVQCRSLRIGVLSPDVIGSRPAKPFTQKQLLREFTEDRGLLSTTSRAKLPRGFKSKFDEFSRRRIRGLTGQTPAKVTYQDWLTRQGTEFQNDVLGNTRGKLFRSGDLKLDKFVNRAGDDLTLSQLARREASAFRKAGLDPGDFL